MNNDSFQNLLLEYKNIINERVLSELKNRKPNSLYKPLIYFINSGGKRLRAILLLLSANAFNDNSTKAPINQAIAIELLHNFTLIHDDIMDNSDKRHNKQTLHKKYDVSTAILAGDSLLALAYEFLLKDLLHNELKILNEFTNALTIVCEGQALDKEFELRKNVTLKDYYRMISMKTGALIKATCRIGALTRTDDTFIIDKLGEFGEMIGIAFQIQDDLLDVIGNEKKFGKKRGSDLIEGKKTYLLLKALKKAKGKDLDLLKKLIENKGINPKQLNLYIELYNKLGLIEDTKREIDNYYQKCLYTLEQLKQNLDTVYLEKFLSYVINRQH